MTQRIHDIPITADAVTTIDGVGCAEGSAFANSNNLDRALAAMVRNEFATMQTTITAANLTTIDGIGQFAPLGGNTTITGFATAVTGVYRELRVLGTPMVKYNATSLITPNGVDYQAAADDSLRLRSLGGGNWLMTAIPKSTLVQTADIAANAVTFAKMQAITDGKLLGASGGTAVEEITVGTGLTLSSNTLSLTSVAATTPYNYIGGCAISNNAGTPNTKVDIAAGQCSDTANAVTINVTAGTINFGTTGANGLDTGAIGASTYYAIYVIAKADGTQAGLASLSFTAPTMPATYTVKRRVGFVSTDGSSHILPFIQTGRRFERVTPTLAVNGQSVSGRGLLALDLPSGKKWPVFAKITTVNAQGAVRSYGYFADPDRTDQAISLLDTPLRSYDTIDAVNGQITLTSMFLTTNVSAQIAVKSNGFIDAYVVVEFWEDDGL